jgi:hypothetical protein
VPASERQLKTAVLVLRGPRAGTGTARGQESRGLREAQNGRHGERTCIGGRHSSHNLCRFLLQDSAPAPAPGTETGAPGKEGEAPAPAPAPVKKSTLRAVAAEFKPMGRVPPAPANQQGTYGPRAS